MKPIILYITINQEEVSTIKEIVGNKFEIIAANTGAEALLLFDSIHSSIKIVLIDLSITDMDGQELLKQLQNISVIPEYIVISEQNNIDPAIEAMKHGAFNYITKPINPIILLHSLKNANSFSNPLKRLENNFSKKFLVNFEKRIKIINELVQERRSEGNIVTDEELISFFSNLEHQGIVTSKKIRKLMENKFSSNEAELKYKVLIVEDEEDMRESLTEILSSRYEIVTAENGEEAIEKLKKHKDTDIVLLDIGLPDILGIELMPKLQAITPNLEIIMLTAFDDIETVVTSFQKQAFAYITKPYNPKDLFFEISKALQKRCFNKTFPKVGQKLISYEISEEKKIKMVNTIAKHREFEGKTLLMEDIYLFFPQFEKSGLDPSEKIPLQVSHDGIGLFIEHLKSSLTS